MGICAAFSSQFPADFVTSKITDSIADLVKDVGTTDVVNSCSSKATTLLHVHTSLSNSSGMVPARIRF